MLLLATFGFVYDSIRWWVVSLLSGCSTSKDLTFVCGEDNAFLSLKIFIDYITLSGLLAPN